MKIGEIMGSAESCSEDKQGSSDREECDERWFSRGSNTGAGLCCACSKTVILHTLLTLSILFLHPSAGKTFDLGHSVWSLLCCILYILTKTDINELNEHHKTKQKLTQLSLIRGATYLQFNQ